MTSRSSEWARERLVVRHAEYLQTCESVRLGQVRGGRHLASSARTRDVNALVDVVAIAEAFSVNRLMAIRPVSFDQTSTWSKREKVWRAEVNINLPDFASWDALMGYVDARNAFQHNEGRLTEMQVVRWQAQTLRHLRAASVSLNGDVILLTESTVTCCVAVCKDFIVWLEASAPA